MYKRTYHFDGFTDEARPLPRWIVITERPGGTETDRIIGDAPRRILRRARNTAASLRREGYTGVEIETSDAEPAAPDGYADVVVTAQGRGKPRSVPRAFRLHQRYWQMLTNIAERRGVSEHEALRQVLEATEQNDQLWAGVNVGAQAIGMGDAVAVVKVERLP